MLLTIDTPHLAMLRCIVRVALDSDSSIHPVTRVVPSVAAGTTPTNDFVSHRPVVHRLVAHLELNGDLMNPPSAGKLQQTQPTGPKVLMRMLARQLLQGLLLRFSQFNGTFHGQAGGQDEIASQTRHSEIRLLDTLSATVPDRFIGDAKPIVVGNIAAHYGFVEFTLWWYGDFPFLNIWTDITVFDPNDPSGAN